MPGVRPRIAAIVLNYRTVELTERAIASLQAGDSPPDDIIAVENGSGDGSEERLRGHPDIAVVQTGSNLGFTGGMNAGIRVALQRSADLILLVNSDVILDRRCLSLLTTALRSPVHGIAGPMVLTGRDFDRIQSAGISYSRHTGLYRMLSSGKKAARGAPATVRTVDGLSGCAMLVKREVFETIGLFEEAFFFTFEDLDFCLRAGASGFHSVHVSRALALHEGSRSIGERSPLLLYYAARNHLLLAERAAPDIGGLRHFFLMASVLGHNAGLALFKTGVPRVAAIRNVLRGVRDHLRRRYGAPAPDAM